MQTFNRSYQTIVPGKQVLIPAKNYHLSSFEKQILQGKSQGLTNKEIAYKILYRSQKTVDTYVSKILQKMNCQSITQAVAEAIRNNIIE